MRIQNKLWLRGGFPRSYLAKSDTLSLVWRKNFIRTFLERDLSNFGIGVSPESMRKFWKMTAHLNGQPLNLSALAHSMNSTHTTAKIYLDVLKGTYMLELVEPYHSNVAKRLRKTPKVYIADTGILHALLDIKDMNDLLSHPVAGFS